MNPIRARFGTIRARLTLWNILVLLLLLAALGLALRAALRAHLVSREDGSLRQRGGRLIAQLPALTGPDRLLFLKHLRDSGAGSAAPATGSDDPDDSALDAELDAPPLDGSPATPKPHRPRPSASSAAEPLLRPVGSASGPALPDPDTPKQYAVRLLRPDGSLLLSGVASQSYDSAALAPAISRGREMFTTADYSGDRVRVYTIPLRKDDGGSAALQIAVSETPVRRQVAELTQTLLLMIPVALLLAGGGAAFLTDRALRPVKAIQLAAAAIGGAGGDLSSRLPVRENGRDEIAALEVTINSMLARIESSFLQQQRFTADASHELRTPLAIARTGIDVALLAKDRTPEEYRSALVGVGANLNRMSRMVDDLLLLARADAGRRTPPPDVPVPITALVREAVEQVFLLFSDDGSTGPCLEIGGVDPPDLATRGDSSSLARLLRNLLENAARHTPAGGEVRLTATAADTASLRIEVADTGSGIAPEHLPHVTERFYRVESSRERGSGGGSGLGLALCQEIARAHGGSLTVESELGVGTRVLVTLPRSASRSGGE